MSCDVAMRDATWPLPSAPVGPASWPLPTARRATNRGGVFGRHSRHRQQNEEYSEAKAFLRKYGPGMALGFLAVHLVKRIIRKIPVVGIIARPILDLFPTIVVGPALGAAITYGIVDGEGDLLAARRPISEGINTVSREVEGQIRQVRRNLDEQAPRLEANVRQLESDGRRLVGSLEREITPVIERHAREVRRTFDSYDWPRR